MEFEGTRKKPDCRLHEHELPARAEVLVASGLFRWVGEKKVATSAAIWASGTARYRTTDDTLSPVCADDPSPYKRIAEGKYLARCVGQHLERVRMYGNAVRLRLDFQVLDLDENPVLCKFFHLGKGERPQIGRKSHYFRAWVLANKGQLPRRGQKMSACLFLNKLFRVRVSDVRHRWDSSDHAPNAIYSTVSEILELCLE